MAKIDEKVMSLVQDELKKNPGASVDELYEKAESVAPGVSKLSKRQFNARYPLQVKRRMSAGTSKKKAAKPRATRGTRKAASGAGDREAVRDVFLRFASDLAAAEQRKEVVKVLAGLNTYVDEVLRATGK